MTYYEALSLLASTISVIIAATLLVRTRRLTEEQLKLAKLTEELSKKQIVQLDLQEKAKGLPKIHADIVQLGRDYAFIIANRGEGSAFDLNFELVDCPDSPLLERNLKDNFPHPELRSQARIKLCAAIHMGSPTKYIARISWHSADRTSYSEDFHLAL
jgi:hypothetical protein